MNILRRLPLYRLLLLCGVVIVAAISATALALALGSAPTPPAKPLAVAVHDALGGSPVEGVSANIKLTNHLLEGANLAGGGQGGGVTSSPLLSGASGRLWIAKDGRARLELQAEKGDTQLIYDGHTVSLYDTASNTVYRYTPPASTPSKAPVPHAHEAPTVAKIEEAIKHIDKHANVSGATPGSIGGQPAYTVRISPKEGGSLLGGAELSFDANNGAPLRAAIFSSTSSSPVIELAASEVSFGPVADSVFAFTPPAGAKIEEISPPSGAAHSSSKRPRAGSADRPKLTTSGHGLSSIAVVQAKAAPAKKGSTDPLEGLPKVTINGASASELRTQLGTLLTFERSGVRYLLAGAVPSSAIEALARSL